MTPALPVFGWDDMLTMVVGKTVDLVLKDDKSGDFGVGARSSSTW